MNLVETLRTHRLLAIVRGNDPDAALRVVLTLAEEGIEAMEISLTTNDAPTVIARARAELGPEALVGAGTVRTAADAARAVEAGASYLVTPALVDILRTADVPDDTPVLMGALTPSEIELALARGACAIKLFPASLGGPAYLRALRDPFPDVPIVPVGGVDAAAARDYLGHGALAVGVGSPLIGDAADGGDLGDLRTRAAAFRAMITRDAP
ncbi:MULTISPECIES: bifunctional 4-hydroxy-2-oxoglutarate aldolase/2-dehydro-3-deoxy-phosphogluconate aldolase [unclassified Streptomyces]|uniref:bifunctional 4-hydroxy-2-oxoglutarate aldolase/2-dehydro-3-deoxy-phosphogluconate aldolase n=1 Tax=unclassified Streptomyces TaxID=2593676 RepID=UPI00168A8C11|nr:MULTISPECIES: bifunctional 4-hydroxy-2-oxoglutarate aldolase/2-dehydro-3-deoxy-phosphogluconate aldolase [unclassified Streptomyces]MBD3003801.1 bifunctional 4-hydroxy-2-oxoglutarate aldolase/2-dehydro-3-deoxy-phosphogluconate aldolase [Streptomyces sp. 5-10]